MKKRTLLSFLLCFLFTLPVLGQVKIIGIAIPGLHESNGSGEYDKVINTSVVKSGSAVLKISPPSRAFYNFKTCNNCCLSPANLNPDFYDFKGNYQQTRPMAVAKIYIFTARGSLVLNNIKDLKGLKVGARRGMPYGRTVESSGIKLELVNTIEQNIKKLQKGRLNAFIAYVPDAYTAFQKMGIKPLPHDQKNPLAIHEDSLLCKGVSAQFIKEFNAAIK